MTTLREIMQQEMRLKGLAASTQRLYLRELTRLFDYYHQSPKQLSDAQIKSYLHYLISERHLAPSTYNVAVHALRFFYYRVLRRPIDDYRFPLSKRPQKLPDILSVKEVERMIRATPNLMHRTMMILAYGTGLRASELCHLRVEDIDRQRMQIHIRRGKGGKDRYVILSPVMVKALCDYWRRCRRHSKSSWLFIGQFPDRPVSQATFAQAFRQAKERTGIHKSGGVHSLRHAFATHCLDAGEDVHTLQQLLGHASILSTARYLRMTTHKRRTFRSPVEGMAL